MSPPSDMQFLVAMAALMALVFLAVERARHRLARELLLGMLARGPQSGLGLLVRTPVHARRHRILHPGNIHQVLRELEREGLLEGFLVPSVMGGPSKHYQLTAAGWARWRLIQAQAMPPD